MAGKVTVGMASNRHVSQVYAPTGSMVNITLAYTFVTSIIPLPLRYLCGLMAAVATGA